MWRALARFGVPLGALRSEELAEPGLVFQIGVPPCRIDVLTSIDGVSFEAAWTSRTTTRIGDVDVRVLGRTELMANKRAVGRPKDLADIAELERESRS